MIEQLKSKIVHTRKAHRCFACGRTFPPKTNMVFQTCVSDGYIYSLYSCDTCEALIFEFADHFEQDGGFPEDCVCDQLFYDDDTGIKKTPEELLNELRNEKKN